MRLPAVLLATSFALFLLPSRTPEGPPLFPAGPFWGSDKPMLYSTTTDVIPVVLSIPNSILLDLPLRIVIITRCLSTDSISYPSL